MNNYLFEKVECRTSQGGAKIHFENHREIIKVYAEKGFLYVGWIPTVMDGYGHIKEIDLIFQNLEEEK